MSPLGGVIGDRIGFRPVLVTALAGAGAVVLLMPFAPSVASLALLAVVLGASTSTVTAMVFGLLATEIPSARRSATLNLVYLPLYAAGIVGPAVGAAVATGGGVAGPFLVAGVVLVLGAAGILVRRTRTPDGPADEPPDESVVVAGTGFRPEG
jgi:DHA1 family tetracycline resistance protein-like MFS transporter